VIALALALLAQAAAPSPAPADSAPAAAPRSAEEIWQMKCKFCHGEDGKSQTKKGRKLHAPDFTKAKWQKHTTDQEIVEAVTDGITDKGKPKMPSFKEKLAPGEIQSMVPYLRAFAGKQ
jgi:mono/diheme cytochrome c family protein